MDIEQQILKKLMYNKDMSYNRLRDEIPSNKFSYHLNKLIEQGIIVKEGDKYNLTADGIHLISSLDGVELTQKKKPVLCTFVLGVKDDLLLVNKRAKQPFMDYIGIPGGKVEFGGSMPQEAAKEFVEETGLKADNLTLRLIINFRTYDKKTNELTHHVVGFFFLATDLSGDLIESNREGDNLFISRDDALKEKTYPDFDFFTKQMLSDGSLEFKEINRFTSNGDFVGIDFLD